MRVSKEAQIQIFSIWGQLSKAVPSPCFMGKTQKGQRGGESVAEIWKDIRGLEGLYQISTLGHVKSLRRGIILKQRMTNKGYAQVVLSNKKAKLIHRLVAEAFIPNPCELPYINHKDECKHNNCVNNLEWCTASYNNCYNGLSKRVANKRKKAVRCRETGQVFDSIKEAERTVNVFGSISPCLHGRTKTAAGCHWEWA